MKIWEELLADTEQPQVNGASGAPSGSRWVERAVITEAKGSVRAVEFAPHHFGLKLARTSSLMGLTLVTYTTSGYDLLGQHPSHLRMSRNTNTRNLAVV